MPDCHKYLCLRWWHIHLLLQHCESIKWKHCKQQQMITIELNDFTLKGKKRKSLRKQSCTKLLKQLWQIITHVGSQWHKYLCLGYYQCCCVVKKRLVKWFKRKTDFYTTKCRFIFICFGVFYDNELKTQVNKSVNSIKFT